MKISRKDLILYAITDEKCTGDRDLSQLVEEAILGGATCIQLREKNISDNELTEKALELKKVCSTYGVPLIINDNYKVALRSGADGVHVGIEDAPVREIRRIAGNDFIIGATAKTVEQAKKAQAEGADYIGVGAVFPSPTKTNAIRITQEQLREICSSVDIPAVAIGGISLENVNEIGDCGQAGIAVVSAVFAADDVRSAAEALRKKLDN